MKNIKFITAFIFVVMLYPFASSIANAGVIDRIKDIYEAPDKLQEIQDNYDATKALMEGQLESQREELELSKQQASELLAQQESYRKQNELLMAENQQLLERMEKMEANRQSIYSKIAYTVGTLIALIALYAISVRIWRYIVWRKQGREQQGAFLP
ncbi:hypothetical protein [Paenibacillus sp. L3-i20]|uniref:hypothetical protein n=1 Tax=Paenibacillus sp. L3-i20 TaxID=2905833 RepID=UPI001EDFE62A|nr:hypothetical protein [Paenibacillus sp. L3-i20]GKU77882.1 hypothetical protein L3i20_v222790 [Paenibacillus sp. L3-i20]